MVGQSESALINPPIFIIGCGRSGTTLLGKIFEQHKNVLYLNEPRSLWYNAYPETDIWTSNAEKLNGKLFLSSNDVDTKKSQILKDSFQHELIRENKCKLIEKLPINAFRLEFIDKIFPNAIYIHIYRNGLHVARSIEQRCINGRWFGLNKYKWLKIKEYVEIKTGNLELASMCVNYFDKGLLEWRLSTEAIVKFLSKKTECCYTEVSYYSLINNPYGIINKLINFIGIQNDPEVGKYATKNIKKSDSTIKEMILNEKILAIGGNLLIKSMETSKEDGLVRYESEI